MELREFLSGAAEVGEYESTDEFGLDTLRSRSKLALYQLPEPGLWLVRIVQGAVALGVVGGVQVQFSRRRVRIVFRAEQGPTAEELLRAVFSGAFFKDSTLDHLVTGLRSCAADNTERIEWFVSHQGQGSRVAIASDGVARSEASYYGSGGANFYEFLICRPAPALSLKRALRKRVVDLARQVSDEYSALVSRCWCMSVPLEIDGQPLAPSIPHPQMRHLSDCQQVGCPVDRHLLGDQWLAWRPLRVEGPELTIPTGRSPGEEIEPGVYRSQRVRSGKFFLEWESHPETNAALFVSFAAVASPGIDFICDGAVVDTYDLPYARPLQGKEKALLKHQRQATSFRLFIPVGAEQLDLTGFQVKEKEKFAQRLLDELRPRIRETLSTLEEQLPDYQFCPTPNPLMETLMAPLNWWNNQYTREQIELTLGQLQGFLGGSRLDTHRQ